MRSLFEARILDNELKTGAAQKEKESMRFSISAKVRSILIGILALSLGMFMALTTLAWFSLSIQSKGKVFENRKLIRPEIVSIIEIERDKKVVTLGEEFDAGVDWLKGAEFKLRNDSGKEIVHLSFELEFPETASLGSVMVFPIWRGHRPGSIVLNTTETLSLKPNEKLTIAIDEATYARLVRFIETRQALSTISKATLRIEFVAFADGTGWSGGEYLRQDPRNPRAYVPIKK